MTVNHEINNPLFVITSSVDGLKRSLFDADSGVRDRLERISEACRRIQRFTQQLSTVIAPVSKEYLPGLKMLDIQQSVNVPPRPDVADGGEISSHEQPLRFALAGCGSIAPTHARALAALPDAALIACADSFPNGRGLRRRVRPARDGLARVLADPAIDAVTVCTPSGLHAALGVQALRAGKHVVVEKPMDITLAACDALLAAQRESGRTLAVISQHRFDRASWSSSRRWTRACSAI